MQYSLFFKQYGAGLSNEHEPIVDQHVLRAFEIYSLKGYSELLVGNLRKKSLYKSNDKPLLDDYKIWFVNVMEKVHESEKTPFKEKLDKILFQLGKKVKICPLSVQIATLTLRILLIVLGTRLFMHLV